jgi:quinol monooxygenase YgiN
MITIDTNPNVVTMINVITVRPENQERLVELMISVGESLKDDLPGLISVSLHKSSDGTRVVNYQQWESEEAFRNLQERFAERMRPLLDLAEPDPHLYTVVYTHSAKDG